LGLPPSGICKWVVERLPKLVKDLVLTPKSTLITGSLPSALVPDERVDYAIVLPPAHRGQEDDGDPYPLLLTLHGLKGSRDGLVKQHEHGDWDARFTAGVCPQMVVATISGGDNYYMDFHDKSAMWETFLVEVHSQRLARRFPYEIYSTHVHLTYSTTGIHPVSHPHMQLRRLSRAPLPYGRFYGRLRRLEARLPPSRKIRCGCSL